MTSRKKSPSINISRPLLVAVTVFVFLFVSFLILFPKSKIIAPINTSSMSDSLVYKLEMDGTGYSFIYPASWEVKPILDYTCGGVVSFEIPTTVNNYAYLEINRCESSDTIFNIESNEKILSKNEINVDGHNAKIIEYIYNTENTSRYNLILIVVGVNYSARVTSKEMTKSPKTFTLLISSSKQDESERKALKEYFNQIVSTLKFIE